MTIPTAYSLTDIDTLLDHLKKIGKGDWEKLFSLLDEIERTKKFGEMKGMENQPNGSITFPYWDPSEVVNKVICIFQDLDILPVFEWSSWKEGQEILNNKNQDYDKLDPITLCKLLTTIIRANRLSDGYLIGCFNDGIIQKIIYTLKSK